MVIILLAACDAEIGSPGTKMEDYFPFDGSRESTFVNDDATLGWLLILEKVEQPEPGDGREIWTFEYWNDVPGEFLGAAKWSNASGHAQIHGWSDAQSNWTEYDPPIDVTDSLGAMHVGDSVTTETGGTTWTSTFVENENCPVAWSDELDDWTCANMTIDDGQGDVSAADPATRPIFVGEYWFIQRYWIAWMDIRGYDTKWDLQDFEDGT